MSCMFVYVFKRLEENISKCKQWFITNGAFYYILYAVRSNCVSCTWLIKIIQIYKVEMITHFPATIAILV